MNERPKTSSEPGESAIAKASVSHTSETSGSLAPGNSATPEGGFSHTSGTFGAKATISPGNAPSQLMTPCAHIVTAVNNGEAAPASTISSDSELDCLRQEIATLRTIINYLSPPPSLADIDDADSWKKQDKSMNTEPQSPTQTIDSLNAERVRLQAQLADLTPSSPSPAPPAPTPDEPLIAARMAKGLSRLDAIAAVQRQKRYEASPIFRFRKQRICNPVGPSLIPTLARVFVPIW